MTMITLPRQDMLDILDASNPSVVVRDRIVGKSRWSVEHELVFQHRGTLYITHYTLGATEYQDEQPWEYADEVRAYEAEAFTTTDYRIKEMNMFVALFLVFVGGMPFGTVTYDEPMDEKACQEFISSADTRAAAAALVEPYAEGREITVPAAKCVPAE